MEVLTRLLPKLAELLVGEYNLQKEVKGGIKFLQVELEHMKAALEKISTIPADQLDKQDKIWARDVRELSYDIEDKVDTFMVRRKGCKLGKQHGFKKVIDRILDLLMQPKIRHKIATDIRDIKGRVKEVSERRDRYRVSTDDVPKPVTIDPRLFARYEKVVDLVGIDEARDEVINILMEENDKIVSIVGFGGLGKTSLANVVYEKLRAQFDCSAFVSVSQIPDTDKLFKDMLYQVAKKSNESINVINELREFLEKKRYLIVIDDIWDISIWRMIKCALPYNNIGCKIVTTTRILSVAEQAGDAYKLKPLSLQNSRKLLYTRIFGNEKRNINEDPETCPDEELAEVSDKIIKKCAGVPLAIITIASLLASKGRNKMEWYEVYNAVGSGMQNSLDAENMRRILSYSYYDLPSHLRTCLLYLSMFPEDFEIEKNRLIWLWRAEGFIQCGEQKNNAFEVGESYFNELINRCMIQPVDTYNTPDIIYHCRVHDMVLDLIRSLSSEENFVTILRHIDHTSASTTVRRLSIQNSRLDHATTRVTRSMSQVRSVAVFLSTIEEMPAFQSFKVLRVLDLQGCCLPQGYSLKYLSSLFQLRYLSLRGTHIDKLPKEIGNLQFLETLNVEGTNIYRLPLTVARLKHLMCLSVNENTRVPNGIGSLRSLEELSWLRVDNESTNTIIEELGLLTELRVLRIILVTDKWKKLVESLSRLQKIQSLCFVNFTADGYRNIGGLDPWVAPRHLRNLETREVCWFSRLPSWMNNPSRLMDLSLLSIAVRELQQEDLEILGEMPNLCTLDLQVDHEDLGILGRFIIGAGSFPCLVLCKLWGFIVPVVFQQGAARRLARLEFKFYVREVREISGSDDGFHLGLGNLLSLRYVYVWFRSGGASDDEVEEEKAAVRKAAEIHPNQPTLQIC